MSVPSEWLQQMLQQQAGPGVPGMVAPGGGPTMGQPPMGGAPPGGPPMGGPPGMPPPGGPPPWATQGAPPPGAGAPPGGPSGQDRAMMDLFTRLSKLQPQQADIARKRAMVDQLRAGGRMPGMREAGGVTQAANPLEFLGALGSQGLGAYKEDQANKAEDVLSGQRRNEFDAFRKAQGFGDPKPLAFKP